MSGEHGFEGWPDDDEPLLEAEAIDLDAATPLRFVLQQRFTYAYAGPVSSLEQRLVVVPPRRHGRQRRVAYRISISGAEGFTSWSRDAFANRVVDVRVPAVDELVEFRTDVLLERSGEGEVLLPRQALQDPRYLDPTRLTDPDDAIRASAHDTLGGLAPGLETAELLCALIHSTIAYRKGVTTVSTTAAEAFRIGAGVCQDHAHIMLAMCRTAGLPARYISGHMLGEGATHAWVEVLVPHPERPESALALAFDPCHGRRPDASYIMVAIGRDYADVAPASGTYRGGHANRLTSSTRVGLTRPHPRPLSHFVERGESRISSLQ